MIEIERDRERWGRNETQIPETRRQGQEVLSRNGRVPLPNKGETQYVVLSLETVEMTQAV